MDRVLYTTLYGSHLYGTNTSSSDLDIKRIVLPNIDNLLLCKAIGNKVEKTNKVENKRNSADDVDQEDIPLQVFIKDFVQGQTYALEIAFSVNGAHAQQTVIDPMFERMVAELRTQFLTSNIKSMMGYVFNQANIYSFKGERLNCAREFESLLHSVDEYYKDDKITMGDVFSAPIWSARLAELETKYPKYIRLDQYDIGGERTRPCIVLLEKTFPFTNLLDHSFSVLKTIIKKYGSRADAASQDNVDWKAMMHAVRIIDEGLELLEYKTITLPRPPETAVRLLQIKRGELPLEPIKDELSQKLDQLKDSALSSALPSSTDVMQRLESFTLTWLRRFYNLQ